MERDNVNNGEKIKKFQNICRNLSSLCRRDAIRGKPLKSYFNHGIPVSIHSNYPALSGSADDPFGIMEIAVTGSYHIEKGKPFWMEELVTRGP